MPKMSSAARRWSQVAFTILISLVLAVSFYTAVVVGQPTESEDSAATKAAWRTDETGNPARGRRQPQEKTVVTERRGTVLCHI